MLFIQSRWPGGVTRILDVTCGIGTQALGLASKGYNVVGADISEGALARARKEAEARRYKIPFGAADMRQAHEHPDAPFDLVLSADNAVTHLLTVADILEALASFHRATRPGGGCLVSMRAYDQVETHGVQLHPMGVRDWEGVRWCVYQVWQWRELGAVYDVSHYLTADDGAGELKTYVMRSAFFALNPERMMVLFEKAGFRDVERIDDVFFQPVIVGTKAG